MKYLIISLLLLSACAKPGEITGVQATGIVRGSCVLGDDAVKFQIYDDNGTATHSCWQPATDPNQCFVCERIGG